MQGLVLFVTKMTLRLEYVAFHAEATNMFCKSCPSHSQLGNILPQAFILKARQTTGTLSLRQ